MLGYRPQISCFQEGLVFFFLFWHFWGGMAPGLVGGMDMDTWTDRQTLGQVVCAQPDCAVKLRGTCRNAV